MRAGDGMRDLIVCGRNSRNRIFFDPRLDRFRNCRFFRHTMRTSSDEASSASSDEGSSAFVIGVGRP
jgi:hypothetical protein